jgi:predicted dehydrogenase
MKILIIGLGSIGLRHARNFAALGAEIAHGVDPSPERRERFERETGGRGFATLDEALAQKPDLAVVASPSRMHIAQALACARAGCHLFIEKPLGTSLEGIDTLIAEIGARKLFAHVGSNFKFHPAMQTMHRLLQEGALGTLTAAQVLAGQWLPSWHPWEDYRQGYSARAELGGGIVLDTHEFDYLLWLLGPVTRVEGFCSRSGTLEIDTEDVACACFQFESGVLATVQVDYIQRDYRRRYHVSGDAGTMEWDFSAGTLTVYRASDGARDVIDVKEDLNEMYVRQSRHVLESIASGGAPATPVAHASRVLDIQLRIRANRVR